MHEFKVVGDQLAVYVKEADDYLTLIELKQYYDEAIKQLEKIDATKTA
jgi:hypothetical protein